MHSRLQSLHTDMMAVGLDGLDDRDAGPPGFLDSIDYKEHGQINTKEPSPLAHT
jgi:hypothetical protein